ncbi:MAG: 30S ribosomal protein S18 [Bdellovibrionales bacterium]
MNAKKGYRSKYRPEYPVDFKFDYKDPASLTRFLMDAGKIVPARVSKLSNKQQNLLARAIKKARQVALVPQGTYAADQYRNPEMPAPKTFEY